MRAKLSTLLTVIGAVTVLVLAGNTVSMAATGKSFLLGKTNKASTPTTLVRTTNGTVLKVTSKNAAAAPLSTNATGKVTHLNADKIDGLDSPALTGVRAKVFRYSFTSLATGHSQILPTVAPGAYLATYSVGLFGAGGTNDASTWQYCWFEQNNGTTSGGISQTTSSNPSADPFLTASTVLMITAATPVTLRCGASKAWNSAPSFPAEVSLTKLDGVTVTQQAASSGRVAAGSGPVRLGR